jgi:hypothetical protein
MAKNVKQIYFYFTICTEPVFRFAWISVSGLQAPCGAGRTRAPTAAGYKRPGRIKKPEGFLKPSGFEGFTAPKRFF